MYGLIFFLLLSILTWVFILVYRPRILNLLPKLDESYENYNNTSHGLVSVVIPTRNEQDSIGRCIDSLLRQKDVKVEIIVVDDSSSDNTVETVREYERKVDNVKLILAPVPPVGWVGKSWACKIGYENSKGDWLLFTDADAIFTDRECIKRALAKAHSRGAGLITLYPRLLMDSLSLKAVIPILTLGLYFLGKPHKVSEGKAAFLFGSFILIRRAVYEAIGGHTRVRDALLEDRALALSAREKGAKTLFIDGVESISARWNKDLKTLWNGVLRLFIPLFLPSPIKRTVAYTTVITILLILPIFALALSLTSGSFLTLVLSSSAIALAITAIGLEAGKHKAGLLPVVLWPFGAFFLLLASLVACYRSVRHPVIEWRGRRYVVELAGERERARLLS